MAPPTKPDIRSPHDFVVAVTAENSLTEGGLQTRNFGPLPLDAACDLLMKHLWRAGIVAVELLMLEDPASAVIPRQREYFRWTRPAEV